MATVTDLKVPHSRKSELKFKIGKHVLFTVDICGRYGHAWNWHNQVPEGATDSWSMTGDTVTSGNVPFAPPFRSSRGYAWACEREGCDVWLAVSQMDSTRYIPVAHQKVTLYGSYGHYKFDKDSPFCDVNQAKKRKAEH